MSQEERNDAEDRAREERRREDAIVRNRLADAITDTLQSLSSALLNNAKADRVTLQASSFSANFARQSILPADPSAPPPVLNATQAPAALFIDPNASDPAAAASHCRAGRNPPDHWFTSLRDAPRNGVVREAVRDRIARLTARLQP